jgi:multidrug efflux pump subunit AcrA (membrane-fusion protein)
MSRLRRQLVKPWILMPLVAVIVLGGWMVVRTRGSSSASAAQASDQVVTATTGTVAETVSAQGTVAAAQTDDLDFGSAGTVTVVNVTAGQQVKAGDVLAEIDSASLAAAVSDAQSSLAQAQANLSDDEAAGASTAQLNADNSSVATAYDKVVSAQNDLDGAKLVATFDGTVSQVNVTVGEQLGSSGTGGTSTTGSASASGGSSSDLGSSSNGQLGGDATSNSGSNATSSSTPDIQVVSPSSFTVDVGLDNTDVSKVAVGQSATVTVSTSSTTTFGGGAFPGGGALPGTNSSRGNNNNSNRTTGNAGASTNQPTATGTVTSVSSVADASSGVAKYTVRVAFDDTSGNFNAGASVDVKITYAQKQNVVEVPAISVTTSNGTSTVTVSSSGQKEVRKVTTGLSSGNMIEITSGVQAGEQVVVTLPSFGATNGGSAQQPANTGSTG